MKKKIIFPVVLFGLLFLLYRYFVQVPDSAHDQVESASIGMNLGDYSEIEKLTFEENYAYGLMANLYTNINVKVIVTKEQISYTMSSVFSEITEETTFTKSFNEQSWEALFDIIKNHHLTDWDIKENYLYDNYSLGPTYHIKKKHVECVRQGDFFNLNPENIYLGMDQNELDFRSGYEGRVLFFLKDHMYPSSREYNSYGVPPNYNEFRQELWDFVIEYVGGRDWRIELGQIGKEVMYQTYPYMTQQKNEENPYQNIRYFSILENYGGKETGPKVRFTYDGGKNSLLYTYPYPYQFSAKLYSIDETGRSELYYDDSEVDFLTGDSFFIETIIGKEDVGLNHLLSLLEQYQVLDWDSDSTNEFYSDYVNQGFFFNLDYLDLVEDEHEREFRSSYDTLINIICSDGTYKEIRLENGHLPQTYNEFRTELWDYFIEYNYRNQLGSLYTKYEQSGFDDEVLGDSYDKYLLENLKDVGWEKFLEKREWRNYIDEQGYQFMLLKYPYMDLETKNSE